MLGGRTLSLETGRMAKQANGAVYASYEGSAVLATACCGKSPVTGLDYVPLQVEYNEKFYAAGKTTAAQADPIISPRPREEFYVLTNDPYQIVNQVENPNFLDELNHLQKVLDAWQDRTGDTTPSLEKATPDRHNRKTGERYYKESRPSTGELPGESKEATMINDPGPR